MACLIVTDSQVRHLPARPADLSSSQWQLTYGPHDLAHVLERVQLVFITATTLPLLVALTEIGLASGTMLPENAAALVGAGVLSVVLFPSAALAFAARQRQSIPSTSGPIAHDVNN